MFRLYYLLFLSLLLLFINISPLEAHQKIEKIIIVGNNFISIDDIMINILTTVGETVDYNKLEGDRKRIYDSGYFKKVEYKIKEGKDKDHVIVEFIVEEVYRGRLVNVDIKNVNSIKKEVILSCLNLRLGEELTKERLEENMAILTETGFFREITPQLNSTATAAGDGIELVFNMKENPKVKQINFEGNTIFDDTKLSSIMKTKKGEILNLVVLNEDRKRIEALYLKNKYIGIHVYDVKFNNDEITFYIGEGIVEDIRIIGKKILEEEKGKEKETSTLVEGKLRTKDYVIRREMYTKVGDILKEDVFIRDLQRIHNLGFFQYVDYRITPGTKIGNVILHIILVEKEQLNTLRFGAGYSSEFKWSGMLTFQHNNLFGRGKRISLDLQFGGVTSYEISYHEPWLDKKRTSLSVGLFDTKYRRRLRQKEGISEYKEKKRGFSVVVGRPLKRDITANVGFEQKEIDIIHTGGVKPDPRYITKGRMATISCSIIKDTRDNIFAATKGVKDSIFIETSGGILGGDYDFTKYRLEGRRYLRIKGTRIIFATRCEIGLYYGERILSEEFIVGGPDTLRGYREYISGTKSFIFNNELRFPITGGFTGVIFIDLANAWREGEKIKLDDIKSGAGFGIRIEVPGVGPIRLDWGRNLQTGETDFGFSFGHMF